MDPLTVKFIQLLIAQALGVGIILFGVYFFFKGISGKTGTILIEGVGIKAKIVNSSPGVFLIIVGVIVLSLSLSAKVEQKTTENKVDEAVILKEWLDNTKNVSVDDNYIDVMNKVVGKEENNRVKVYTINITKQSSLSDISQKQYGSINYWPLVSVANKDRGYFEFDKANPLTTIVSGSIVEIWKVSRYHSITKETLVHVHTKLIDQANERLLALAEKGIEFDGDLVDKLSDEFRNQELGFGVVVTWDKGEFSNIGELSIKYYGKKKFWKLITWANSGKFVGSANASTKLPSNTDIFIPRVTP